MIGSGLRKLAKENGMQVAKGVAYGFLRGYAATMDEGAGYKRLAVTTRLTPEQVETLGTQAEAADLNNTYRVQNLRINEEAVEVFFFDNPGTMACITAFLDWLFPALQALDAPGAEICPICGMAPMGNRWLLVNGIAYFVHPACAAHMESELQRHSESALQRATGSCGAGALGALLGALLGGLVWALVLGLGYMASLVGFLIAWLADKGYTLLHGKPGRGKIVILALAIVIGVLFGTVAYDAYSVWTLMQAGELPGLTLGGIPSLLWAVFVEDAEYRAATLKDMGIGLLFAALGAFGILWSARGEGQKDTVKELPEIK